MHNYKELKVWQKSIELTTMIYAETKGFPKEELYGLSQQMRRAAVSVCSNIAEGAARRSDKEFRHFLSIAYGSLYELETQLLISHNLGYRLESQNNAIDGKVTELQKMMFVLIKNIEKGG